MGATHIDLQIMTPLKEGINEEWTTQISKKILFSIDPKKDARVEIVFTDDDVMRLVNSKYRGFDETTDVLAFMMGNTRSDIDLTTGGNLFDSELWIQSEAIPMILGEVMVSIPMATKQAAERNVPLKTEITHLLVHGILHLWGYDHEQLEDAKRMNLKAGSILEALDKGNEL